MNKYKEVILPIVEEANSKIFNFAAVLSVMGIAVLASSVGFLEVSTLRTIGVITGLGLMVLPFALRFVIDKHKKIGVIRFSDQEILTKLNGDEPRIFDVTKFEKFEFTIVDFEGETKAIDLVRSSRTMNVRSGAENQIFWIFDNEEHLHQFKLSSELHKRQVVQFLKSIQNQMKK
ncbi:MAG: hypothetical protein P8P74_12895 [Crocinitomicaceae bacterium]|nr:hypothetical protein [Crocinitomicaceae bacterium]